MRADLRLLRIRQLDTTLKPWSAFRSVERPSGGWISAIRQALGMTLVQLGDRIGADAAGVKRLEEREVAGTVTLETLRKAAAAMDCDLVYAVVPRTSLQATLESRASQVARVLLSRVRHSMALEDQAVGPDELTHEERDLTNTLLQGRAASLWEDRDPGEGEGG